MISLVFLLLVLFFFFAAGVEIILVAEVPAVEAIAHDIFGDGTARHPAVAWAFLPLLALVLLVSLWSHVDASVPTFGDVWTNWKKAAGISK